MKKCLLLLVVLSSCQFDTEIEFSIDSRVADHVDRFFAEAEARGINIPRENLIVSVEELDPLGRSLKSGDQRVVLISADAYDFFGPKWMSPDSAFYGMENVVFHELGHALLNRKHCDPCYSIMNSGISVFVYAKKPDLRKELIDELFNN